jgi:predicted NBD/HSP70 family sugar kinase
VDYLAVAACDLNGEQLFSRVLDYTHVEQARSVADTAVLIAEARGRLSGLGRGLLGIGVGVPGMLTPQGLLRVSPNLGWREVPIVEQIASALTRVGAGGVPFTALNDARARAMSHYVFGSLGPVASLVYLNVGIGVGAGIVIDDRLMLGHEGFSGEVGHSILEPGGLACACGRHGCAEALLSLKGVSRLVTGHEHPALTLAELTQRLERGDERVREAARMAGQHLGLVAHNLIVTINPAVVIVGGPLSTLRPFVDSALESLRRHAGESTSHHAIFRTCSLGATAGAVGAAASVLHEILHPVAHPPPASAPASHGARPRDAWRVSRVA